MSVLKSTRKDRTAEEEEYYSLTKKVWDILAPFYDFFTLLPMSRLRNRVVDFAGIHQPSKILDVATGTGQQAFAFAKRGFDVVGIDLSEAMLRVAVKKNKYSNLKFQIADATNLPFASNSFDVACISFALHDMPLSIQQKVLAEMARVTKPGGTVIVVDYGLPKNRLGRFLVYHFVKLYEKKYYPKFINTDLKALLKAANIDIIAEKSPMLAARILKGTVRKDTAG